MNDFIKMFSSKMGKGISKKHLILLLILSPFLLVLLVYLADIENSAVGKKYIANKVSERVPGVLQIRGDIDFYIRDGYHFKIDDVDLSGVGPGIDSLSLKGLHTFQKKTATGKKVTVIVDKIRLNRANTQGKTDIQTDNELIELLYTFLKPLYKFSLQDINLEIQSHETIIATEGAVSSSGIHFLDTHCNIGDNYHLETKIGDQNHSLSVDLKFKPDENGNFLTQLDCTGTADSNPGVLKYRLSADLTRDGLNYDGKLDLARVNPDGDKSTFIIDLNRSDEILKIIYDFSLRDLSIKGDSAIGYKDNVSFVKFIFNDLERLLTGDDSKMKGEQYWLTDTKLNLLSKKMSGSFSANSASISDLTSLLYFLFDSYKLKRFRTPLLTKIKNNQRFVFKEFQYDNSKVGDITVTVNGARSDEIIKIESEDFFNGSIVLTMSLDNQIQGEANPFEIIGDFRNLNLKNIVSTVPGGSKYIYSGILDGFIGVEGAGIELFDIIHSLNGEILLESHKLVISSVLTKIFSTTLRQTVKEIGDDDTEKNGEKTDDNQLNVTCARSLLFIDKGFVVSDNETVLVTEHTDVHISGSYDMNGDFLDIGIVPNTKTFFDISSSFLLKYFRATGPLKDLSLSIDSVELVKAGTSLVVSAATGPLGVLAFDFLADSIDKELHCKRTLNK